MDKEKPSATPYVIPEELEKLMRGFKVEKKFSDPIMQQQYEKLYKLYRLKYKLKHKRMQLLAKQVPPPKPQDSPPTSPRQT
ncbi:hypothetical protein ACFL43_05620 [Thermodesulfobacteriota bacterium]